VNVEQKILILDVCKTVQEIADQRLPFCLDDNVNEHN